MPANAGIQVRFQFECKNRLDSGFRRNECACEGATSAR
jgi:hypothetical protein